MRGIRAVVVVVLFVLAAVPPAGAQEDEDDTGTVDTSPDYVPPDPAAWVLVDADTGAVLDAHEPRTPHLPASTIKLLTALVAYQRLPADTPIPISYTAESMPARKINVKQGQTWDLEDLLNSMLLVSANDAAVALAERVGGGTLAGWEEVAGNAAANLGLEDGPDLSDPAGLDDEFSHGGGSLISARDLAIVSRAVLAEPDLMTILQAEEYRFAGGDGLAHRVDRRNRLFELYEGTVGMKTGLTERAGRCFVGAARRDGRTMLVVLFDAPDMYASARLLLDQGFATPVRDQDGLDHLPEVVAGAALDPPARIPGAFDPTVPELVAVPPPEPGLGWNSPPVAVGILVAGVAPLVLLTRRRGGPTRLRP